MKLLFDHQTFVEQPYGGISRYIIELMNGINAMPPNQARLSLFYAENAYLPTAPSGLSPLLRHKFRGKRQVLEEINKVYTRVQLLRQPYDVFHATYYDPYFLPFLGKKPFVVTFHDMIHERYRQDYKLLSNDQRITRNKKRVADQAAKLIAVSESTKRDVVELLDIDPAKIQVIYHGSSLVARPKPATTIASRPYLLFVGHRHAYKNFQAFLKATAALLKKEDCLLICAGGEPFSPDEQALFRELNVTERVMRQPIDTDETLRQLYENAVAFVYPSLYEGFGIPILEAFACDCPCIVSNTSSLPEVAADAALYIDPLVPESMAGAVEKIIADSDLRQSLIEKGRRRLAHFSWQNTVNQTMSLYKSLV